VLLRTADWCLYRPLWRAISNLGRRDRGWIHGDHRFDAVGCTEFRCGSLDSAVTERVPLRIDEDVLLNPLCWTPVLSGRLI
jgi:hypothetical protein